MAATKAIDQSLIDHLKSISSSEFDEQFDDILFNFINSISTCDAAYINQIFELLVQQCFLIVPFEDIEARFFKPTFPKLKEFISNFFEDLAVSGKFEYNSEKINGKLEHCAGIIKCIVNVLECCSKDRIRNCEYVSSIPINTAYILCYIYKHCKSSESIYGNKIQDVYGALSNLFSISQQLQNNIISLLTVHIQYNVNLKEELSQFVQVFEVLVECGEYLIPLDVRSTASLWKAVSELAEKYRDILLEHKATGGNCVMTRPISFLCREIDKSLMEVIENKMSDSGQVSRIIKLSNFLMKILMKLYDLYKGCVECSIPDILAMLYTVFGISSPILVHRAIVGDKICELIQTHIHVGVQILVGNLLTDEGFISAFLNKNPKTDNLSYLLLSVSILKRLIPSTNSVRHLWMSSKSNNIINNLFFVIGKSHYELSLSITYPGVALEGQPPVECDLYELLLTYIGGFVLCAGGTEFEIIEDILLRVITDYDSERTSNIWPMVLASDLICLVVRYGTSDLCYQYVLFLAEILSLTSCTNQVFQIEFVFAKQTLSRIFCFLPISHKQRFLQEYSIIANPAIYAAIELTNLDCINVDKQILEIVQACEVLINDFLKTGAVLKYDKMTDFLQLLSTVNLPDDTEYTSLVETMGNLWRCAQPIQQVMNRISYENNLKSNKFLTKFIMLLSNFTSKLLPHFNNNHLLIVFTQLIEIIQVCNVSIKLQSCAFMKSLCTKHFSNDVHKSECLKQLSGLFKMLLNDNNALVEQMALEAFATFSQYTKHETVLTDIVKGSQNLPNKLKQFMTGKPCNRNISMDLDSYLKQQSLYEDSRDEEDLISSGQTLEFDDSISDIFQDEFDVEDPPTKIRKVETNGDMQNILKDIAMKTDLLISKSVDNRIHEDMKTDIVSIIAKLNSLLDIA